MFKLIAFQRFGLDSPVSIHCGYATVEDPDYKPFLFWNRDYARRAPRTPSEGYLVKFAVIQSKSDGRFRIDPQFSQRQRTREEYDAGIEQKWDPQYFAHSKEAGAALRDAVMPYVLGLLDKESPPQE